MSKPQLIILSDIFGNSEEQWMDEYVRILSSIFNVSQLDSRALAGIESLPQDEVHAAFVNGGINRAVQALKSEVKNPRVIIGFSVGGTIAWKYALENSNPSLYLISATRLRNETTKPSSQVHLYYGELEENGPKDVWFRNFSLNPAILNDYGHECYKEPKVIRLVCDRILKNFSRENGYSS